MNSLFERRPNSVWSAITSMLLMVLAYVGLVFANTPISFTFLALAGVIGLYLNYGLDGIKLVFSPLQKGATKIILKGFGWNVLQSYAIGIVLMYIFKYQFIANKAYGIFDGNTPVQLIQNVLVIAVNLIGEECLVICPSLLGIYFLKKQGVSEKWSMILVTLIGAFLFGLAHFFTYQGNLIQIFGIIALARLPFNWAAFKANSIWASSIVHILFDISGFLIGTLILSTVG